MWALLYRLGWWLAGPLLPWWLARRAAHGKEEIARLGERYGYSTLARPAGRLLWCHGASVGESRAFLPLLPPLLAADPTLQILITSGTTAAARLLPDQLPARCWHHYVPLDHPRWVNRFLNHWQPDAVLWFESDLWPNMLRALARRQIPAALLGARLSAASAERWQWVQSWITDLLASFMVILTPTATDATRLQSLGARSVRVTGHLKYAAAPLPDDTALRSRYAAQMGGRPVVGFISTHAGEEMLAARAHQTLRARWPDLLTIIVPRHPARAPAIMAELAAAGLRVQRRSASDPLTTTTDILLVDSFGELGVWYRLCPIAVVGGSFGDVGGHNPIEPAQLGSAVLFGPGMRAFASVAAEMIEIGAARQVDASQLGDTLQELLADPVQRTTMATAGHQLTQDRRSVLMEIQHALRPVLARAGITAP